MRPVGGEKGGAEGERQRTNAISTRQMADGEFVHIAQCRGIVTNSSNHWIIRQPDLVSKTETMARGTEVLFAATRTRHQSYTHCNEH